MVSSLILLGWMCFFFYTSFPDIRIPMDIFVEFDDPTSIYYNTTNQTILDQKDLGEHLFRVHLIIDIVFFSYFTIDLFIRFVICPRKREFILNILNIFDFFSILLFWVFFFAFIGVQLEGLFFARRVCESLRFFTLFRIFKLHWKFRTIVKTFVASAYELLVGFITICMVMVTMSTIIFYCEVNTAPNNWFDSIPATFWWTIVTITTVIISFIIIIKNLKVFELCFLLSRLDMETFIPQVFRVKLSPDL